MNLEWQDVSHHEGHPSWRLFDTDRGKTLNWIDLTDGKWIGYVDPVGNRAFDSLEEAKAITFMLHRMEEPE